MDTSPVLTLHVPAGAAAPPPLVPAPRWRHWLPPHAAHCTPLLLANQWGWTVLTPHPLWGVWHGGPAPDAVEAGPAPWARGHFGHGILTTHLPFRVETSPDVLLWVKAVPNYPIDGLCVLEGLVETDWFDGSFTVNFRFTRPGVRVSWPAGAPLVQLVPYPRGWLERTRLVVRTAGLAWAAAEAAAQRWAADRAALLHAQRTAPTTAPRRDGAYRRGQRHDGGPVPPGRPQLAVRLAALPDCPSPEAF